MSNPNFTIGDIRFEDAETELIAGSDVENSDLRIEIDEIFELRRLVAEITEPEPTSYTTT
jgi:hypothetical protein